MSSHEPEADAGAAGAPLLRWGIVAGPFYLAVGLTQALLRDGFDLARHPLSVLANGSWGWVQTANFVLSGLMVLAAAVGFGRVLGPRSRAFRWSLAGYGLGMILAAIFPADPVDGFPPGTPKGMPTSISTTGLMHFVAGALTFMMLGISGLAAAWTMMRRRRTALALWSLFSGLSVLIGFFGGIASPIGIAGIWFAVVIGWIWLAVMSFQLQRPAP
jgi:hypothetical protein